ncbi:unnamed protein product [Heterobilharzia americana]|nr:unnamed protein product [Heterobilharzia americana]
MMEMSEHSCTIVDGEYKEEVINRRSPYAEKYRNNIKDTHLMHLNENGIRDDYAEMYSPTGSLSSSESVEIPCGIRDGTKYHDLAAYIDSVTAACTEDSSHLMDSQLQLCQNEITHLNNISVIQSDANAMANAPMSVDTVDAPNVKEVEYKSNDLSFSTLPHTSAVQYSIEPTVLNLNADSVTEDEFVEEFADFVSDGPADENWAAFSPEVFEGEFKETNNVVNVQCPESPVELNDDDEDFGDFTQFAPNTVSTPPTDTGILNGYERSTESKTSTPGILERLLLKLEPSLDKAFGSHFISQHVNEDINLTTETIKIRLQYTDVNKSVNESSLSPSSNDVLSSSHTSSRMPNSRIWNRLFNPGRLPEIRQQWWKSPIFMMYLNAIDVNPQNAIPVFASQLRLLEPIRLTSQNCLNKNTIANSSHTSQDHHIHHNTGLLSDNVNEKLSDSTLICNKTPFSNDNSNGKITEMLDLDFFETRENTHNSKGQTNRGSKHSELSDLEAELSAYSIPPPTIKPFPPVVADLKLLEINKRFKLSETVRSTLNRLPMINYMRSKRLMFPVQQQQPSP